jgi:ATP-dependent RNA helicase DDX5/DBP2
MAAAAHVLELKQATAVQRHCWPCCLLQHDTVGVAPTGSGKTLAFALPLVELRRHWPAPAASGAPLALVLVPTRELAQQVSGVCRRVLTADTSSAGVQEASHGHVMALHGGDSRKAQIDALQGGPSPLVIVATPGRLLDLSTPAGGGGGGGVSMGAAAVGLELGCVRYVVLDEADKLLLSPDLAEQVQTILSRTHPDRQTCLFTATLGRGLPEVAATIVRGPPFVVHVDAAGSRAVPKMVHTHRGDRVDNPEGEEDEHEDEEDHEHPPDQEQAVPASSAAALSVPLCIKQEVSLCAEHKKPRKLMRLLEKIATAAKPASGAPSGVKSGDGDESKDGRVLIFANKIKSVQFVTQLLQRHGVPAAGLSSQLSQRDREGALHRFMSGALPVLVSTDVAARGVHIENLRHVINWDFGTNLEQYVHRVGRTGRHGRPGTAHSFFSRTLRPLAPAAVALLRAHDQKVDQYLQALAEEVERELATSGGGGTDVPGADEQQGAAEGDAHGDDGASSGDDGEVRMPSSHAVGHGSDLYSDSDSGSDVDDHAAQRWLAGKLKSPITGMAPAFGHGVHAHINGKRKSKEKKRGKEKKRKEEQRSPPLTDST